MHLEVSAAGMNIGQANEVAEGIERKLRAADPAISAVVTHQETASDRVSNERAGHGTQLKWYVEHIVKRFPGARLASPPILRRLGDRQLHLILRVSMDPKLQS
jgi:hypothetical protein